MNERALILLTIESSRCIVGTDPLVEPLALIASLIEQEVLLRGERDVSVHNWRLLLVRFL